MNRKLSYKGKELSQMSKEELVEQMEKNKRRMFGNHLFLGSVSVAAFIAFLPAVIVTVGVGAVRTYWLLQNNQAIEEQLSKR